LNLSVYLLLFIAMQGKSPDVAVIEFAQAIGLLVRRIRAAASGHELSLTEYAVLARLAKNGPATTAATLEEMGLVHRKPHPTDGRQMKIDLTAKGTAVRSTAKDAKRTWLAQAMAQLSEEEREILFRARHIIKRLADL
jgi:hypothetical protein